VERDDETAVPVRGWIGETTDGVPIGDDARRLGISVPVTVIGPADEILKLQTQMRDQFDAAGAGAGEKLRAAIAAAEPDTATHDGLRERLRGLDSDIRRAEATLKDARVKLRAAVREGRDDSAEQAAEQAAEVALTRFQRRRNLVESDANAEEKRLIAARNDARSRARAAGVVKLNAENAAAIQVIADEVAELLRKRLPELAKLRGEADWLLTHG
jgi:hypothetical protein